MTGLAVDADVFAGVLGVCDVAVAGLAGGVAGKVDGAGGHLTDSRAAIVAVFAEGLGDDEMADDQEDQEGQDEEPGEPEEVTGIFKFAHETLSPERREAGVDGITRV